MTRGVLDVRLVAKALFAPLAAVREMALPLVDISIPLAEFSPFAVLSNATPDGSATRAEGSRKRADSPGVVRMGMEPAKTVAAAPRNKAAVPGAEAEADRTVVEAQPVFSFRSRTEADKPRAKGKTTGGSTLPLARVSDLLRAAPVEAAGGSADGYRGPVAQVADNSGDDYSPVERLGGERSEPPSVFARATGSPNLPEVRPATAAIQAIAGLAQDLFRAAPPPSATTHSTQTDAAQSAAGPTSHTAPLPAPNGSSGSAAGSPVIEAMGGAVSAYPEILRSEATTPRTTVQAAAASPSQGLPSSDLADLINEALVEQARRHGVDLS